MRYVPDVNRTTQKCTGRQDNSTRADLLALSQKNTRYLAVFYRKFRNLAFQNFKILLRFHSGQHFPPVNRSVRLRPGPLHGGTLAAIKKAKLNASPIGHASHETV